jgi:hypothetical protein
MAKRRKEKDEKEEFEFKLPKFDEAKFLKKEKRNIKTTIISFVFGFIIAIISFGFWALLKGHDFRWELVLLFGVFSAAWLRYIFLRLNIDLTDFGRKGWFGSYAIYFLTWLIILIVICNPPFYDDEEPRIEIVVLPAMQEATGTVEVIAKITDNADVEKQGINFTVNYPDGREYSPDFTFRNNIFEYVHYNTDALIGEYAFTITARDTSGRTTKENGTFTYDDNTIKVPEPLGADVSPGPTVTYTTTIKFDVEPAVSRVYYTVDGGEAINATKHGEYYETTPEFKGWPKNKNVTVQVYAEIIHYFEQPTSATPTTRSSSEIKQFNNTIIDGSTYYFTMSNAAEIGMKDPPKSTLPNPKWVQVPGFELLIFIISLIVVVLIFKYRRRDKRH